MKEDFLHYVWRFLKFDFLDIKTTNDQLVVIDYQGNHNHDEGPDFLEAKLKIGDTQWVGSVEMHLKSSDWHKHKHSANPTYENVILHVVWEHDKPVLNKSGHEIPCLELKNKVHPNLISKYEQLLFSQLWIPCADHIHSVPELKIKSWLDRLLVERLEIKTEKIKSLLLSHDNNWEQVLFILIARMQGLTVNADNFENLASSINVEILYKHSDNLFQLEAILFGQAGLLNSTMKDEYGSKLYKEYNFLKTKYSFVQPMSMHWKLSRLRPANFPTIRLSQLAKLYNQHFPFDALLQYDISDIILLFSDINASLYWDSHYLFDKELDKSSIKKLGKSRRQVHLINAVAPIIFLYGKERDESKYIDKAMNLLASLPSESNKILKSWKALGISSTSAFESQALLQLKKNYCVNSKCLNCSIGHTIMNKNQDA